MMNGMFSGCNGLILLDLSTFDTNSVTDMSCMFSRCSSLSSLNLSTFNTSSVTDMSYMFHKCSSLTSLDLSTFDTSSVGPDGTWSGCIDMFSKCSELKKVYVKDERIKSALPSGLV